MNINLKNSKGRDAVVSAESVRHRLQVRWLDEQARQVNNVRLLKSTLDRDVDALTSRFGDPSGVAQALIDGDPEIDFEQFGTVVRDTSRVYVDIEGKIVHSVQEWEVVRNPDGTEKTRRIREIKQQNISEESPLKWSGKLMKRDVVARRFVFSSKQQIVHINGLTYDFLYGMAKELEEKDSLMLLSAGPKGNEPLVFRRAGKQFWGFLEGRTQGDKYCLLLHLSNLELKEAS